MKKRKQGYVAVLVEHLKGKEACLKNVEKLNKKYSGI